MPVPPNVHDVSPSGRNGHREGGRSRGRTTQLKSQAPQGFAVFGALTPVGGEEPGSDLTEPYGSAKLGELPRMALTEKSVVLMVRARSLRTQQRVKNRCQQTPSDGSAPRRSS